jgi:hypothetical protein
MRGSVVTVCVQETSILFTTTTPPDSRSATDGQTVINTEGERENSLVKSLFHVKENILTTLLLGEKVES